jgi:hypothetical protein
MPSSEDYRSFAIAQRRAAENSSLGETRDHHLELAAKWDLIAEDAEQFEKIRATFPRRR